MTKYFEDDKYEVWGLAETGEVGIKVKATGQILLTNPYNASTSQSSEAVKANLLSQIILTYSDSSGTKVNFNSYSDAAVNGQIKMNKTRTGLRTEYTLGKEQAKYLVPRQIEKNSFEQNILEPFEDKTSREFKMLSAYYTLQDISDPTLTESMRSLNGLLPKSMQFTCLTPVFPTVSLSFLQVISRTIRIIRMKRWLRTTSLSNM